MESIPGSIQIRDPKSHLLHILLQLLLLQSLHVELFLQVSLVLLELFLLLLLLVVQLHDVLIHCLDLLSLSLDDLLVVLLNSVVVHFGVAFITNTVKFFVHDRKLPRVLRTDLADGFCAFLTVTDWVVTEG